MKFRLLSVLALALVSQAAFASEWFEGSYQSVDAENPNSTCDLYLQVRNPGTVWFSVTSATFKEGTFEKNVILQGELPVDTLTSQTLVSERGKLKKTFAGMTVVHHAKVTMFKKTNGRYRFELDSTLSPFSLLPLGKDESTICENLVQTAHIQN